jgi:GNAT superfamily N-acetyltransferase/RimJ/RimL family protein N-acetyltransferase
LAAGVKLEQFGPLDVAALQAGHGLTEAGRPADHPCLPALTVEGFRDWWFHGDDPRQSWLARDDSGEPVGCYQLILPVRENRATAFGGLFVAPARRRAGTATALLAHCATQARQAGRVRLASTGATRTKIREDSAGAAFAAAVGASIGLAEMIRIQEITADLLERLASPRAEAERHAGMYELRSWAGLTPDADLEQVAQVSNAMSDAPRESGVEPEIMVAERVRAAELSVVAHGARLYSVAALRSATGEFAALTQVSTYAGTDGWASQGDTVVRPPDRGHRLGILVKIAMLDLVTRYEAGLRYIVTGNAESNVHMAAINERLGYRVADIYRSWELDLAAVPGT